MRTSSTSYRSISIWTKLLREPSGTFMVPQLSQRGMNLLSISVKITKIPSIDLSYVLLKNVWPKCRSVYNLASINLYLRHLRTPQGNQLAIKTSSSSPGSQRLKSKWSFYLQCSPSLNRARCLFWGNSCRKTQRTSRRSNIKRGLLTSKRRWSLKWGSSKRHIQLISRRSTST